MFHAIAVFFRAIGRLFTIVDVLAKEGELMAKDFAKENKIARQRRLEAIQNGQDPDADDDDA